MAVGPWFAGEMPFGARFCASARMSQTLLAQPELPVEQPSWPWHCCTMFTDLVVSGRETQLRQRNDLRSYAGRCRRELHYHVVGAVAIDVVAKRVIRPSAAWRWKDRPGCSRQQTGVDRGFDGLLSSAKRVVALLCIADDIEIIAAEMETREHQQGDEH